ncbi:MAG: DEAD/DEAH box helicase, partial [Candidatus Latescibacterota bacterium]
MDVDAFLSSVASAPDYAGQIVYRRTEPGRQPVWAALPLGLHPGVLSFLESQGIGRLYRHQAEAVEAALAGHDVLITTRAASGKSLCFQLPILQALLTDPRATALLLFPTKALARDQMAAWNRGVAALAGAECAGALGAAALDADAAPASRAQAREAARVLVTNPEMLHTNLLPGHGRWARFWGGLRLVVIDEVHTYNGFFGANMANVMRRLHRVCRHYGTAPRFICSSATLSNAAEAAGLLTGRPVHHVGEDGSPGGTRTYVFWNPPRVRARQWRGRRSATVEAHELMVALVRAGVPTICFSKARNSAELIYRYVRETLRRDELGLADRVAPYRGGYAPEQRRELERRLRAGELLGVSTTRALELGIDIGMLDACIIIGYPGTLNAFLQQAGRAGRSGRDSLCVLVGIDTAINQYVMSHPEFVFGRPIEQAVIDRDNPFVALGHVRCAAAELPIALDEGDAFGYATHLALEVLEERQKVHRLGDRWHHSASEAPAFEVRLRGYGDESTVVTHADTGEVIDRVDKFRALRIFYPGAIYFHQGDTYALVDHDTAHNVVRVRPVDVAYYTDPVTGTAVDHVDRVLDERTLGTGRAFLGEVFAVLDTPVYERVPFHSVERLSRHAIRQARVSYEAMSFWVEAPADLPPQVAALGLDPDSGMRGILYCASRILPLFHTSDANDFDWTLGCRNTPWHTLFWFEFYMHGIGHAEACFDRLEEILALTLEHLLTCDCEDGCPNCTSRLITPYHVRNIELGEGWVMSRHAAAVVLNCLLHGASAQESLALVNAPRERRGMRYLPTVTLAQQRREPHRLPLDERTRALLLRKLERARSPRLPVDHRIDATPPAGMPAAEPQAAAGVADSAR